MGYIDYMLAQSSHQTTMPCSAQGINCLNQILEEIDDWGHRRKVADGSWVFPLTYGHTLLDQGLNRSPPYALVESCPHLFHIGVP